MRICVVTLPIGEAGVPSLSHLVDIVCAVSEKVYLITGNAGYDSFKEDSRIHTSEIKYKTKMSIVARVISYALFQLKFSYKLLNIIANVDIFIFYIGGEGLVLPVLIARLFRKKAVLALAGFPAKSSEAAGDSLARVTGLLSEVSLSLSSRIFTYSKRILEERSLKKHRGKVSIVHEQFLNFNKFNIQKSLKERGNLVGYVGRLDKEKGALNYSQSLPIILRGRSDISFLLVGDGQLRGTIQKYLATENLSSKVESPGWIPHDELPRYLNDLRLLVLPSYTEGLPNTMLEAMACGTPVLVTLVGAIPDVIREGETGFIMEDNSPECIARNVVRALSHPNLEQIIGNACALVRKEYNFDAAVRGYEKALAKLR